MINNLFLLSYPKRSFQKSDHLKNVIPERSLIKIENGILYIIYRSTNELINGMDTQVTKRPTCSAKVYCE